MRGLDVEMLVVECNGNVGYGREWLMKGKKRVELPPHVI